jgi:hypothetical protein
VPGTCVVRLCTDRIDCLFWYYHYEMLSGVMLLGVFLSPHPNEPFRVHVYSNPRGEPAIVEAIEQATDVLANKLRDDHAWLHFVEYPEQAEILVHVEALGIGKSSVTTSQTSHMGTASHTTVFASVGKVYELQATAEFLGRSEIFRGRSRTSQTRAASALFRELMDYLKAHYQGFEGRRALYRYWLEHPEHLDDARALCDEVDRASQER